MAIGIGEGEIGPADGRISDLFRQVGGQGIVVSRAEIPEFGNVPKGAGSSDRLSGCAIARSILARAVAGQEIENAVSRPQNEGIGVLQRGETMRTAAQIIQF